MCFVLPLELITLQSDYLLGHATTKASAVPVFQFSTLWSVLTDDLSVVWPSKRTQIEGIALGDAWSCSSMPASPPAQTWETIVPFHKLTQWLCYSLMVPMTKLLHVNFVGVEKMTGLPEYRNGGLLVDTGLLTLKEADVKRGLENFRRVGADDAEAVPTFEPADDAIVEWRALTVCFLDELLPAVNHGLGLDGVDRLSLAQMLEAGSWKVRRQATVSNLTDSLIGWSRDSSTTETYHEGSSYRHLLRRHSLLISNDTMS